ncbi:hypothetical protein F3K43_32320 [Streptomyces sp. LBUM 1476]|uniref:Lsr2 family DNA-binding protein n=1 Tax=Streptomyces acidiscabies TaxID=42234 RepID=UPI00099656C2|nr:hypothetical protein [Streptomyces sp. LBUM 1476]MBZ3911350.1 Lsr2 family protein [Streptomyces acidiscabies]
MTRHPTGVLVAPPGEVRSWARRNGHPVPDRGRLRADIWAAWHAAHQTCFGTQAERIPPAEAFSVPRRMCEHEEEKPDPE